MDNVSDMTIDLRNLCLRCVIPHELLRHLTYSKLRVLYDPPHKFIRLSFIHSIITYGATLHYDALA